MAIRKYKPTTSGRRHMMVLDYKTNLSGDKVTKSLTTSLKKHGGRTNTGVITVRHRGGESRRKFRLIDFKRNKDLIPATVKTIEYDPNRSANIALLVYADGEKRYILAPKGLKVNTKVISGENVDIKIGNSLPLANIPDGTYVHNIELKPGQGAQIARSAGVGVQLVAKDSKYATVKLKSGEVRKILIKSRATIGSVGNEEHSLIEQGKAGRMRHLGIRPTVRGSAMNPIDHPHGGGEGRQPIGRKTPMTKWGKKAFGVKTRKTKKHSDKLITRGRKARK